MPVELRKKDILYPELSYQVVGVLIEVYRTLGSSYQVKIYQKAIAEELRKQGIKFKEQVKVKVEYKGIEVGYYFADFIIEDKIILEIKARKGIGDEHISWVINYLAISQCPLGLIINFGENSLITKRVIL